MVDYKVSWDYVHTKNKIMDRAKVQKLADWIYNQKLLENSYPFKNDRDISFSRAVSLLEFWPIRPRMREILSPNETS